MKLSRKKAALIAVIAVIGLLWAADEYPALRFRGDGKISGGPILGYQIEFRKIPFYEPGEYAFHFRRAPREELILELHTEGKGSNDEAELRVKTIIEASIVDQAGRSLCRASGQPLEHGQNPNGWVLMLAGNDAAYWHWNCEWVQYEPSDSYTLTLRIRDIDPKTPRINLIPILRSRGPDLP
ncbi:MAG TPA: hypothetical protein VIX91_15280 [Candidatus Acidoferrum sp.]